jgi:uncharacterized protein (TIGR02266 family)
MNDEMPVNDGDPLELLPEFHRTTRMPLDAVVRLHFEGTVAYQNGFAANVSALGMFVKHPEPPPVGTRLVFELVLGEERKPVQGAGVVAWVRERYDGPGRPAGVGIQFTELDALSRQHIAEALFEYLESQLGVEVADHPDVPDLLAAVPDRTGSHHVLPELVEGAGETPAPGEAPPETSAAPREIAAAPLPFRIFGEEPASGGEGAADEPADEDLFRPAVPPDFVLPAAGAAARRRPQRSLASAVGIAALLAALGFAAWWFLLGPGAERDGGAEGEEIVAAEAPAPRPVLDPEPGAERTLAEAVGALPASAPAPLPAAEEIATESPAEVEETPPLATPPAPPARPAAAGLAARRIERIEWTAAANGTLVSLVADGELRAGSFRWFEIRDDRPRVLVRLTGMAEGYRQTALAAGTPELAGVRTGFHQRPAGDELHVVLDLTSAGIRVERVDVRGDRLEILLAR